MKSNFNQSSLNGELFKKIVESAADGIVCLDDRLQIIYCNAPAENIFDCTSLKKQQQTFLSLIQTKEDADEFTKKLADLKKSKSNGLQTPFKLRLKTKSGTEFAAEITISLFKMENEPVFALLIRNGEASAETFFNEMKQQQLEALGRLASKMAADFHSIIQVIKGYAELMCHQMQERDPYFKQVEAILKASEQAEELIGQLLTFGHDESFALQAVNLAQVYFGLKNLAVKLLEPKIELQEEIDSDLWMIKGAPEKLKQVILNLILNARQAMPRGGQLKIILKNQKLTGKQKQILNIESESDEFVMLQVSDTGQGMTKEVQSKAFEPYFTTDRSGRKSGLGLSVVYGIVKAMQGAITIQSETEKGSTFTLYFPAYQSKGQKDGQKMIVNGGQETILVVEDVPEVQLLLVELLQTVGYRAIGKSNYQEAMEYYDEHEKEIDMIISDVILPDNYGTELIRKILDRRPDLKYLLISGYAEQLDIEKNISLFQGHFLQKPFQPTVFLKMVRQMFDRN